MVRGGSVSNINWSMLHMDTDTYCGWRCSISEMLAKHPVKDKTAHDFKMYSVMIYPKEEEIHIILKQRDEAKL